MNAAASGGTVPAADHSTKSISFRYTLKTIPAPPYLGEALKRGISYGVRSVFIQNSDSLNKEI